MFAGELLLLVAELPALRRQLVGPGRVAVPTSFADLLGQLVDLGPQGVTLGGDVAQPAIELGRGSRLVEQLRAMTTTERLEHAGQIGAQQADVDHRAATLPAGHCSCGGAVLANSRSTSS